MSPGGSLGSGADTGGGPDFDAFLRAHYGRLIGLAGLICREIGDAQDAVQNGLERAWRKQSELHDSERFTAWIDRIVVREAIRADSQRRSRLRRLLPWTHSSLFEARYDADTVDQRLGLQALGKALDALPADQRTAVVLHHYASYSVAEIAEMTEAPLETVRSRLRLARDRLRRGLEADRS
jgi:RNA polymerase sigma-70 factor, ECF subfamily